MNFISFTKLAVAFTVLFNFSKVQGAQINHIQIPTSFHNDACLLSVFDPQESDSAMRKSIIRSPMSKIIDGFIACPDEMCLIFQPFFIVKGSQILVQAVMNSDKKERFYEAIGRNSRLPNLHCSDEVSKEIVRQSIFVQSFVHDVDPGLYLEKLKANYISYFQAILVKATSLKTDEARAEFAESLPLIAMYFNNIPNVESNRFVKTFDFVQKILRNEEIDLNEFSSLNFATLFFASLGFNRLDLAQKVIDIMNPTSIDFNLAINFFYGCTSKYIDDIKATKEFLEPFLNMNDQQRALLEATIHHNDLDSILARFGL